MIRTSESIVELAEALALAQGEIAAAPKDSVNPHFKSRYADLASCWAAARPALTKHGLSIVQGPHCDRDLGVVTVTTRLLHKSGQWLESELYCAPRTPGPQDIGSAITYLRRYGFCALVGVVADEDDDGNAASGRDKGRLEEKREQRRQDAAAARESQRQGGDRPAADGAKPKPGGVFQGTPEQEKVVAGLLEQKGVPPEFWDEIRRTFMGKKLVELDGVIDQVRKGVPADDFQAELDRTF